MHEFSNTMQPEVYFNIFKNDKKKKPNKKKTVVILEISSELDQWEWAN